MNKAAVVKIKGQQYLVEEGSVFEVQKLDKPEASVLLYVDDNGILVGRPTLPGVAVKMSLVKMKKQDKITVVKYKAKSRYRKTRGHRQEVAVLKVDEIKKV